MALICGLDKAGDEANAMVDSAYILKEHEIAKIHCFKQISAVESQT